MKVILNKDLSTLGEEGDVKDVAKGYARNYLFPRGIALPFTSKTVKLFEGRKAEIEQRKEQKRQDSLGLKERLEVLELSLSMPAGANGKLYGAVTAQTIADELVKNGFQIERKRIEIAGSSFKNVGKYKAIVKLYESQSAEIGIVISAQEIKVETPAKPAARRGKRYDSRYEGKDAPSGETPAEGTAPAAQTSGDETAAAAAV